MRDYKHRSELLKEMVFEGVRQAGFPDRPSRRRCMFLVPPGVDYRDCAAALKFDLARYSVLRVEPCGGADDKSFVGKLSLLDCNLLSPTEIEERATEYWTGIGDEVPSVEHEVLFEGSLRVVEVLGGAEGTG